MTEQRNLTDDDVSAIVTKLKAEIARDMFAEAGKGLWAIVRKWLVTLMIVLAIYSLSGGKLTLPDISHVVK